MTQVMCFYSSLVNRKYWLASQYFLFTSGDDENLTTFIRFTHYGLETPRFLFFRHGKTKHVFPTPFLVRILVSIKTKPLSGFVFAETMRFELMRVLLPCLVSSEVPSTSSATSPFLYAVHRHTFSLL